MSSSFLFRDINTLYYEKEVIKMILFMLLLVILLIVGLCGLFAAGVGGAISLILYGDVIVCVILIVLIIRKLIKK